MKKTIIAVISGFLFLGVASTAQAVVISEVGHNATSGNFFIHGNVVPAGTGQIFNVLKYSTSKEKVDGVWMPLNTAYDGSAKVYPYANDKAGDQNLGGIWSLLNAAGITSTDKFIFGLDVNEPNNETNGGRIDITSLEVLINETPYSLGESIEAWGVAGPGSGTADLIFEINLGYDFMTAYDASWTDGSKFRITATHLEDGNDEEYFVSPTYYGRSVTATPEPATMVLLGMGLVGLGVLRRRQFKA